jgi:hypothetical protein
MQHSQKRLTCPGCKRVVVIDVLSIGTPHQFIQGMACLECIPELGGTLLKEGEVKKIEPTELAGSKS